MKKLICEASTKDDSRPRIRTIFLKRKKHRNLLENLVIPKFDIESTSPLFPSKKLPPIKKSFFELYLKEINNTLNIQSSLF